MNTAVLHGPPGTGKTLTAEGISELLKCPLYMVSAGELGTDSRMLEAELQRLLDICHAWGAILLLDEADVFLEKRDMHEIHRNALVSIFLRQLEYFQGILFLTTNRVEVSHDRFLNGRAHRGEYQVTNPRPRLSTRLSSHVFTLPFATRLWTRRPRRPSSRCSSNVFDPTERWRCKPLLRKTSTSWPRGTSTAEKSRTLWVRRRIWHSIRVKRWGCDTSAKYSMFTPSSGETCVAATGMRRP